MTVRAFSFGGGIQSTAALVLAAQGVIDFRTFVFANVGENTEYPGTLRYIEEVSKPFAARHGLELVEVRREWKDGRGHTLYDSIANPATRSIGIPIMFEKTRTTKGGVGKGQRACTNDFKIAPVIKWMRSRGATKASPGVVGLGISLDEFERVRSSSGTEYYSTVHPLIDLRISRDQCIAIIERAGLPVQPRSACYFCPFRKLSGFRELKRHDPDLFEKAADLEVDFIARRVARGQAPVYLTRALKPLRDAVGNYAQPSLLDEDSACESGYCMT